MNTTATARTAYSAAYETNGLTDTDAYYAVERNAEVDLADPRLARVTRLRLLTDAVGYGYWDVSYVHGVLKDGTPCRVHLPVREFRRGNLSRQIVEMCREAGVYAKGLGILDAVSTLR